MSIEIITGVLTPAAATAPVGAYDLTDLATVRDELAIKSADTGDDGFLQRAITQASAVIAQYCNRVFQVEGVQDLCYIEQDAYPYQVPGGVFPLQLSRWPIRPEDPVLSFAGTTNSSATVSGVDPAIAAKLLVGTPISGPGIPAGATIAAVNATAGTVTLSAAATTSVTGAILQTGMVVIQDTTPGGPTLLTPGTDYKVDAERGWLINLNPFTGLAQKWPAMPVTVQYAGGYGQAIAGEAKSVPVSPGPYTIAAVLANKWYADRGVAYAAGGALVPVAGAPAVGQYAVAKGIYTLNAADQGAALLLNYVASDTPDDLAQAALRLVTARFKARGRDPMLMSQDASGLGPQRWWVPATKQAGLSGALSPEVQAIVDNYRTPVVA